MGLPARVSFAQISIMITIIIYIAVRGFFATVNIGLLWTNIGGFFLIILPLPAVIVLGFASCVVSYAFSYLGLWLMDNKYYILGEAIVFLSVIIIPGVFAVYSWFNFTLAGIV